MRDLVSRASKDSRVGCRGVTSRARSTLIAKATARARVPGTRRIPRPRSGRRRPSLNRTDSACDRPARPDRPTRIKWLDGQEFGQRRVHQHQDHRSARVSVLLARVALGIHRAQRWEHERVTSRAPAPPCLDSPCAMASTCRDGWCGQGALCEKFSGPFDAFGALRRRRSEIEYPQRPGDDIDPAEVPMAGGDQRRSFVRESGSDLTEEPAIRVKCRSRWSQRRALVVLPDPLMSRGAQVRASARSCR